MTRAPSFVEVERERAAVWKATSAALPDDARFAAPYVDKTGRAGEVEYAFCLPPDLAVHNLLPELRELGLGLFDELRIPWHASVNGGPSNHLLSSQVQCVNALGQMVTDPGRVRMAFGGVVDIAEVLPIEPGRYLTFEFIGPEDYFGEGAGHPRVRGTHCTSVDAAFAYRDASGSAHLALVEWKYTESYRARRPVAAKDSVRRCRYEGDLLDPSGPIRSGLLPFEAFLDEPLYQLMRQQLLAHRLESDAGNDFSTVRVLHVLDPANAAFNRSLHSEVAKGLGSSVAEVWEQLLRRPEKFTHVDPRMFCDPAITSAEYCSRYGQGR